MEAHLRDSHGQPVELTDELGRPVKLTDEHGQPVHLTGVAFPSSDTTATVPAPSCGTGHTTLGEAMEGAGAPPAVGGTTTIGDVLGGGQYQPKRGDQTEEMGFGGGGVVSGEIQRSGYSSSGSSEVSVVIRATCV